MSSLSISMTLPTAMSPLHVVERANLGVLPMASATSNGTLDEVALVT